jgi:hypothetical protein
MLGLFAPRVLPSYKRRYAELELDEPTLIRSDKIITDALLQKKTMTRTELLSTLEQKGISTKGQRAAHILQHSALHGLICQTTTFKNVPNYILIQDLPDKGKTMLREEALSEIALRYFTSRSPATISDFTWWSGLTISDARATIEANKSKFQNVELEGQTYWFIQPEDSSNRSGHSVHLLPGFDEFLLGYKDRSASLEPQFITQWCPGMNGMFMPFIVKNGEVIGLWKKSVKKGNISIDSSFFRENKTLNVTDQQQAADYYRSFISNNI